MNPLEWLPDAQPNKDIPLAGIPKVTVVLSPFEWHKLLTELEYLMRFANRETATAISLYESIATQLNKNPVKVVP